jgi:hypothetical protein
MFLSHLSRSKKMKIKSVFSIFTGIISLALVFGTMALSCSLGDDEPPTSVTTPGLTYSASGTEDLVIYFNDPTPSAFRSVADGTLEDGMLYEIYKNGYILSNGTITITAGTITFTNTDRGKNFTATISDSGSISFDSVIILNLTVDESLDLSGETLDVSSAGDLGKEEETSVNPFIGTWIGNWGWGSVTVTANTWHYSQPDYSCYGQYTYIGKTATYTETGNSSGYRDPNTYMTTIVPVTYEDEDYDVFHTQGITFAKKR